ncbi:tetratricopeptide repeat protein [Legionella impletisoli]|nr:sel1 repeat family protein [Legionella impletisoli]
MLTISFALLLTGCSFTKMNLQEGIRSFQVQDYRSAFIRLKPEAEKGNPDAQYAVGYMYFYGQGVTEDRKKALFWIKCAAKAGQPDAIAAMKMLTNGSAT